MKSIVLLLMACSLILLFAYASPAQQISYTNEGYFACYTRTALQDVLGFGGQMDSRVLDRMLRNGRCVLLPSGLAVYIEETAFDQVKINPVGTDVTMWTTVQALLPTADVPSWGPAP